MINNAHVIYIGFDDVSTDKRYLFNESLIDKNIFFTPKEFELFFYLLINKNRWLTIRQVLDAVWFDKKFISTTVVYVYLGYIRKKIVGSEYEGCIVTSRLNGIKFIQP